MMSGVPKELHFRPREQQNQDAWMPEMLARIRGTTHPRTSMPTSVVVGPTAISSDKGFRKDHDEEGRGTGALGQAYMSLNPAGKSELIKDMQLQLPRDRFDDRRALLAQFDGLRREIDASGVMEGMDRFQQQAADVLLGGIAGAFDWAKEDPATIAAYDTSEYTKLPAEAVQAGSRRCRRNWASRCCWRGGWSRPAPASSRCAATAGTCTATPTPRPPCPT